MAATRLLLVVAVASSFFAALVAGQGCTSAGVCGAGSCGAGLNACYNAAGNQLTCCNSPCVTCNLTTGNATAPTLTVYAVFNASDAGASCANQTSAPGGGTQFADSCLYYTPLVDANRSVQIGNFAAHEQVIVASSGRVLSTQILIFGNNSATPAPDTINCLGQASGSAFQISIVGGTGKYAGAKGYYVAPAPTSETVGNTTITYYQKNLYLL